MTKASAEVVDEVTAWQVLKGHEVGKSVHLEVGHLKYCQNVRDDQAE